MKKVGIVIGKNKDINYIYTNQIAEKLLERGVEVIVAPAIKDSLNTDVTETDSVYRDSDFIICVGGDGTFLKAARGAFPYKKPLLGVNKGTVGFLAEVETGEIDMAIDKIVAGQYHIQPRMVLDVKLSEMARVFIKILQ